MIIWPMCPLRVFKMTSAERVEEERSLGCSQSYLGEIKQNPTMYVVGGPVRQRWSMVDAAPKFRDFPCYLQDLAGGWIKEGALYSFL